MRVLLSFYVPKSHQKSARGNAPGIGNSGNDKHRKSATDGFFFR